MKYFKSSPRWSPPPLPSAIASGQKLQSSTLSTSEEVLASLFKEEKTLKVVRVSLLRQRPSAIASGTVSEVPHYIISKYFSSTILEGKPPIKLGNFSPSKVRVVFFEKITQKISTLSPLLSEILAVVIFRQTEHTQNTALWRSACLIHCTAKSATLPIGVLF